TRSRAQPLAFRFWNDRLRVGRSLRAELRRNSRNSTFLAADRLLLRYVRFCAALVLPKVGERTGNVLAHKRRLGELPVPRSTAFAERIIIQPSLRAAVRTTLA